MNARPSPVPLADAATSPDPGGPALVETADLCRTFGTGSAAVVAVHGVSCRILAGDRVALTGASGSGKSTLFHLLAGLDQPTRGTVSWPGLGTSPHADPSQVGLIFQSQSLIPALSALDNVGLALLLRGASQEEARRSARSAMERVGIDLVRAQLPAELSGGQAQRVAIARVLLSRPRLILADEPTGRLDVVAASRVLDVLLETADDLGAGLVVSTHDPRVWERLTNRWRMRDGSLSGHQASAGESA